MQVEVNIDCIRVSLMTQNRVVILKDKNQERFLPIWIGHFEADAITFELQSISHKRPLTHDLLKSTIEGMGGEVQRVVVTELRRPDDIFYAKLIIDVNGQEVEVDARPSDAIALAVRTKVPIFVDEEVMTVAAVRPEADIESQPEVADVESGASPADPPQIFKDFVETLDLDNLDDSD